MRAKSVRKHWKDLFKVDMIKEYFDGKQRPPEYPAHEWLTINLLYSHVKSQLPALYSADPYFYIKLKRSYDPHPMMIAAYEARARIRQGMLNYLKEELKLKQKARLGIWDAMYSFGVLKSHYRADWIENENAGMPLYAEDELTPLVDEESGDLLREPEQLPVNEQYCWTRIHPDDFLFDEDAGPLEEDWHWVAQRIREPYADVLKNPLFKTSAVKKVKGRGEEKKEEEQERERRKKGNDVKGSGEDSRRRDKRDKEPEIIVRWEIYNLKKKTWLVIAENGEEPLLQEEILSPGVERHPFAVLRFTLRDDSPYPIPPLSQGLDPAKEYNIARSDLLKHRKRFNRKYEAYVGAFEDPDTELSRLESGEDGTIIRKRSNEQAVFAIQDAPLDQMRYMELGYLKADMIELFGGTADEARGIAGSETATQAGILDARLEMKEGDALSQVVDWVTDAGRKMDQLVQAHIDRDTAIRVNGPQGEFWELIRTTDFESIEGEFEYSVNVGATLPRLPQMERSSWLAFLGLLANFPHLLGSPALLKKMAEMHHIEDDSMLEELRGLWQQMQSGQVPLPGKAGSQPGVGEDRPVSAMGGQAQLPMNIRG